MKCSIQSRSCIVVCLFVLCQFFITGTVTAQCNNTGIQFDGITQHVNMGSDPSLEITGSFTLEAWINASGAGSGGCGATGGVIVSREGEYALVRDADGTIQYAIMNTSPGWSYVTTEYVVPLNTWTHLALVYDLGSGTISLYANGVQVYTNSGTGPVGDQWPTDDEFRIGNRKNAACGSPDEFQFFDGIIDEVRVWDVAVSGATINSWQNKPVSGTHPNFANLKGYWRMDESGGTVTSDNSGNGNGGNLVNSAAWSPSAQAIGPVTNLNTNLFYQTVQEAVADPETVNGHDIQVCPGTYNESVVINKSVHVMGLPGQAAVTIVKSSPTVITITGAGISAELSELTISGPGPAGCGTMSYGILVRDGAHANIHDNQILDIRDNPIGGCQNGIGIQVGRTALATSGTATITNNVINGFQKNGITVDGTGSSATISGNLVLGGGTVSYIAQNGIQISRQATGTVLNNFIDGLSFEPGTTVSTGILTFDAGLVTAKGNLVGNSQVGIYFINTSGSIEDNNITYNTAAMGATPYWWGIDVENGTVSITGNTVDGDGNGAGIEADAVSGETTNATITNNIVSNTDEAIATWTSGTGVVNAQIHENSLTNYVTASIHNYSSITQDAECNWFGTTNGAAIAASIVGPVDYNPWITSGTDDSGDPGFQPFENSCSGCSSGLFVQNANTLEYFCSIQDAINDPQTLNGHTINVGPGAFNENVVVHKALTLKGRNFMIPCTNPRIQETIITGNPGVTAAIQVVSDGVTINGFTIKNPNGAYGIGVYNQGKNNLSFTHNIITNVGNASMTSNNYGIYFEVGNTTNSNNVNISQNCVSNIVSGTPRTAGGIYIGSSLATAQLTNLTVLSNTITGISAQRGAYGILFNAGAGTPTGTVIGARVESNEISGLNGNWAHAIGLEGPTPGALVKYNKVSNLTSAAVDNYAVTLQQNPGAGTIQINENSFVTSGFSVGNSMPPPVNAECNWHGSTGGPIVAAKHSGNVDYVPYLTDGTDNSSNIGFQPVPNSCNGCLSGNVVQNSNTLEYFCSIQEAINDPQTLNGHTITVGPGLYTENIVINKELTINGYANGNNPLANTVITAPVPCTGSGIDIAANNVTISNMHVTNFLEDVRILGVANPKLQDMALVNYCSIGVRISGSNTNVGMNFTHILGNSLPNTVGIRVGTADAVNGMNIQNSTITGNALQGIVVFQATTPVAFDNITIGKTTISGNGQKGMYFEKLRNALFTNLIMDNNGTDAGYGFNNGIDINLKYDNYSNITIENSRITNSGANGTSVDPENPAAIAIKARDDSPSYNTIPATLTNLFIKNNVISGPVNGIRLGEFGKTNNTPANTHINENDLGDDDEFSNKAIVDRIVAPVDATCNWYGSANSAVVASKISGNPTYVPYLTNGSDNSAAPGFQAYPGSCNGTATGPELTCPPTVTVQCASEVPPVAPGSVSFTGGCPVVVISHSSDVTTPGDCPNHYTILRTYVATDGCGNTTTCTQTIIVNDNTAPVPPAAPANANYQCMSELPATGPLTAVDNCSGNITATGVDVVDNSDPCNVVITRTWTFTDACNNASSVSQTITIHDDVAPVLTVPADATIECQSPLPAGVATATDNCDSNPTINIVGSFGSPQPIQTAFTGTRPTGNQNYGERLGMIFSVNSPVVVSTLGAYDDGQNGLKLPITVGIIRNSDNVTVAGPITMSGVTDPLDGYYRMRTITPVALAPGQYTIVAVGYGDDEQNGNSNNGGTSPAFNDAGGVLTSISSPYGGVGFGVPANSFATPGIYHAGTFRYFSNMPAACPILNYLTRTFRALDDCGNASIGYQTIIIEDNNAPVLTVPGNLALECSDPLPKKPVHVNSSPNGLDGTYNFGTANFGPPLSSTPVTGDLIVTDDAVGNTADACDPIVNNLTGKIALIDLGGCAAPGGITTNKVLNAQAQGAIAVIFIIPTPGNNISNLGGLDPSVTIPSIMVSNNYGNALKAAIALGTVNVSLTASPLTITDCTLRNITHTQTTTPGSCPGNYTIENTWTVTDACNHSTTGTQTITVSDNTDPVAPAAPAAENYQCMSEVPAPGPLTAVDNCSGNIIVTGVDDVDDTDPCNVIITRTWTFTDACNNSSSVSQTITVHDDVAPVLTVPADVTVECTAVPPPGGATATDNCDASPTVTLMTTFGSPHPIQTAFTGTQSAGNQNYGERLGMIFSVNSPVAVNTLGAYDDGQNGLKLPITVGIIRNSDNAIVAGPITMSGVTDPLNGYYRMRAIPTIVLGPGQYTIVAVGYGDDEKNGNSNVGGTSPAFNNGGGLLTSLSSPYGGTGFGVPTTPFPTPGIYHAGTFRYFSVLATGCPVLTYNTRVYRAVDDCGNASIGYQTIRIEDNTSPVLTVPGNLTLDCSDPLPKKPLHVNSSPNGLDGTYNFGTAQFGAPLTSTPITGEAVLVNDGVGNTADGCETILNDLTGKIAIMDRAGCPGPGGVLSTRVYKAQQAGAIAVIFVNLTPGNSVGIIGGSDISVTIPSILVSNNYGNALKASMLLGTVNLSLTASPLTVTDCTTITITHTQTNTPGDCAGSYTIQNTWTVTDACNNSTTGSQIITVEDNTDPVFSSCPSTPIALGCNPNPVTEAQAIADAGNVTDNCSVPLMTATPGPITGTCSKSQTWTVTASDGCGNDATCTVTYTWTSDTQDPTFGNCPAGPINLGCNPNTFPVATQVAALVQPMDNCHLASVTATPGPVTGTCAKSQVWVVTATDDCGNDATCTVVYNWTSDTQDPTFGNCPSGPINLGCNPNTLPVATQVIALVQPADNCHLASVTAVPGPVTGTCAKSQVWVVTAVDDCGNDATCTVVYNWTSDTQDPTFGNCPAGSINLGCNPTLPVATQVAALVQPMDNCHLASVTATPGPVTGTCAKSQVWVVTATDDCGNDATCTVVYNWTSDTQDPTFANCPSGPINLGCNPAPITAAQAIASAGGATDNCHVASVTATAGPVSGSCTKTQTWTVKAIDDCGNDATCSVTYTWTGNSAPHIYNLPSGGYLGCNPTPPTCSSAVTASNACGPLPVTCTASEIVSIGCSRLQLFCYKATDPCSGLTETEYVIYAWLVVSAPQLHDLPSGGFIGCNPSHTPHCDDDVWASNSCLPVPVTCNEGPIISNGCNRTRVITYSATDACSGLTTTAAVTYTWKVDTQKPVITATGTGGTGYLGCNPTNAAIESALGTATALDNCDGNLTGSLVITTTNAVNTGGCNWTKTRKWNVVDACGNNATQVQRTITYKLVGAPVLSGVPAGGFIGCNPSTIPGCNSSVTASNQCGSVPVTCTAGAVVSNGCGRTKTVTYSATDACSGLNTTQVVTYTWKVDTQKPVITATGTGGTGYLGCNPSAAAMESALGSATALDNCDGDITGSLVVTTTNAVCTDGCNWTKTRKWNVADACGNNATQVQRTITYKIVTAPVLSGVPAGGNIGCNPSSTPGCTSSVTASNQCGSVPVTCTAGAVVTNGCNRTRQVIYTATDACSGMTTTQTVNYSWTVDVTQPSITCPANQTVFPTSLSGAVVTYSTPTATDNCGIASVTRTAGPSSGSTFPIGTTTVTYKATDVCGNTKTCSFTVTVKDPGCGSGKSYVCHNGNTTCVTNSSVPGHLSHGDELGPCSWYSYTRGEITEPDAPGEYKLSNFPNPFSTTTQIKYELPVDSKVSIIVYDMNGKQVAHVVTAERKAGVYMEEFDASRLPAGLYYYRFVANAAGKQFIKTEKLSVIR